MQRPQLQHDVIEQADGEFEARTIRAVFIAGAGLESGQAPQIGSASVRVRALHTNITNFKHFDGQRLALVALHRPQQTRQQRRPCDLKISRLWRQKNHRRLSIIYSLHVDKRICERAQAPVQCLSKACCCTLMPQKV